MQFADLPTQFVMYGESEETAEHILIAPVRIEFRKRDIFVEVYVESLEASELELLSY